MLLQTERTLTNNFVLSRQNPTAEYFEGDMHRIMLISNDDDVIRVLMQKGDRDPGQTTFAETTDPLAFDDEGPPVPVRGLNALFLLIWVRLLYAVLSNVLKSRKFKVILKT